MKSLRKKRVHDQSLDCTEEKLVIRSLSLRLSEAMEARARQRAERRKEIEELKRKKEEEKLVSWKVIFWGNVGVFFFAAAAVVQVVALISHGLVVWFPAPHYL